MVYKKLNIDELPIGKTGMISGMIIQHAINNGIPITMTYEMSKKHIINKIKSVMCKESLISRIKKETNDNYNIPELEKLGNGLSCCIGIGRKELVRMSFRDAIVYTKVLELTTVGSMISFRPETGATLNTKLGSVKFDIVSSAEISAIGKEAVNISHKICNHGK